MAYKLTIVWNYSHTTDQLAAMEKLCEDCKENHTMTARGAPHPETDNMEYTFIDEASATAFIAAVNSAFTPGPVSTIITAI